MADLKVIHSDYYRCLHALLNTFGWRGSKKNLLDVMPPNPESMNLREMLNTLANLRYLGSENRTRLNKIPDSLLPCLFVPDDGVPIVVVKVDDNGVFYFNSRKETYEKDHLSNSKGTAIFFKEMAANVVTVHDKQNEWFFKILRRFKDVIVKVILMSFGISIMAVLSPLLIIMLFSQISTATISNQIYYFWVGIGIYVLTLVGFRFMRSFALAYLSTRIGYIMATQVMRRILFMPPSKTEVAALGAQLAHIRDFESIRQFFSGSSAIAFLELPFVLILIGALFYIGGPIGFVPVAAAVVFVFIGVLINRLTIRNETAIEVKKEKDDYLIETIGNLRSIKSLRLEKLWAEKFSDMSSTSSIEAHKSSFIPNFISATSYAVIAISGLATMAIGVEQILAGNMTAGALMASILLVMRVLSPLRSGFSVVSQINQLKQSIAKVDRIMNVPIERHAKNIGQDERKIQGMVTFQQVALKYKKEYHPALLGVTFRVMKNETVVIVGHGGAGKSSIFKLILGMYFPQAGQVLVDNMNSKQFDPLSLRRQIGYMPQRSFFLKGTIRENLYMVDPTFDDEALEIALGETGLLGEISRLPDGLDTYLDDYSISRLPRSFLRRFNFAMVLLKKSNLWLLDDPGIGMEDMHERQLLSTLWAAKGSKTILIATQNFDYLSLADKVLWIKSGRVAAFGKPDEIMEKYKRLA